jgi:hypothetical protein
MKDLIYGIKSKKILVLLLLIITIGSLWVLSVSFSRRTTSSAWDGVVATSFKSGTGTDESPYEISTPGEYAYMKQLLEGNDAWMYLDKYYVITSDLNFGGKDITIGNYATFSGTLDGKGHAIYNATVTNYLYYNLVNATIMNIEFDDIDYTLNDNQGGFLAKSIDNSTVDTIIIKQTISKTNTSYLFGGVAYSSINSTYNSIVLMNEFKTNCNIGQTYNVAYSTNSDEYHNLITRYSDFNDFVRTPSGVTINKYKVEGNGIVLDNESILDSLGNDRFKIYVNNGEFSLQDSENPYEDIVRTEDYKEHTTGADGTTLYINSLISDWNYYTGYNYASSDNSRLPTLDNKNKYNESNLVKVMVSYSGVEENAGTTLTGTVSSTENYNKIVYYDYLPVENGKLKVLLVDNPFTNRPNGKAFNNWISDITGVTISIDRTRYERFAEINITKNENGTYDPVALSFHASWINANEYGLSGNNWTSAFNQFDSAGLKKLDTVTEECTGPSMKGYYKYKTAARYSYYKGYYSSNGRYIYTSSRYCSTRNGCPYYEEITEDEEYEPGATYYYYSNSNMYKLDTSDYHLTCETYKNYPDDYITAGLYVEREFDRGTSYTGYFDASGNPVSGTCNSSKCTYYELIQSYDDNGNRPIIDYRKNYYFLVTRDTNIAYLTGDITNYWSSSNNKPFTLTGLHNGRQTNYDWTVTSNNVTLYNDTTIEHLTIYNTKSFNTTNPQTSSSSGGWFGSTTYYGTLNANWHNLKMGRGIKQYNSNNATFDYIWGGSSSTGSSSNSTKYNLIIESGHYSSLALTLPYNASSTVYVSNKTIYGSDVDKVLDTNNNNLSVYYQAASSFSGTIRSTEECATDLTVKSGQFGTSESDMYTGIYVGGLSGGTHYAARKIKMEGGWVNNMIGGPLTDSSRASYNDTYIYMTGGIVDVIIGGAGRSPTYGNRIISVTGGKVNYGVLGGSNGSGSDANNGDGTVNGSSYIYIGGNATIGDDSLINSNTKMWGISSGSVFGNGNGKSGYSAIGSNENSYLIIDGNADIKGSVYGGGNYGATGVSSSSSKTETIINILGGTVRADVYGGGNQNGAGSTSTQASIKINQTGGTILGNVYGGSNVSGTVYGSTDINIKDGTINTNVYGGGKGQSTYVSANANIVIGQEGVLDIPIIKGSVYGGSGYGTVNGTSTSQSSAGGNTKVIIHNGVITGSVFGGGQGSSQYTPYVIGNIEVDINGGNVTNVYGGNDLAGTHTKDNKIYLNGGTITNVFGGGNSSGVTNSHVYANGSNVTNIYGGSNNSGNVTSTTILLNKGEIGSVFGGNNKGGTCNTSNVTVEGTSKINNIYGGGNEVNTSTSNVIIKSHTGKINNVYGGGNSASVTNVNLDIMEGEYGNIFGGSNSSGSVNTSVIKIEDGVIDNIFGGNNAGGNTIKSTINYNGGKTTTIYGGGNEANGGNTTINLVDGEIGTIFGGGNSAGLDESHVNITGGNVNNVYGGSNNAGTVTTTNIYIDTQGRIYKVYGGGNNAEVGETNITLDNATITDIFGGGNLASVNNNTNLDINGGTITSNIYGGGNYGVVHGNTNLYVTDAIIGGSTYAGGNGNTATVQGNTHVIVDGNTVIGTESSVSPNSGCVFGGGNKALTGSETSNSTATVDIVGGTIYGNVYGGANTSVINGNTLVNIGANNLESTDGLSKTPIYIKGHIFGGGEANASGSEIYDWYFISVTEGTVINVDASGYDDYKIDGSFYGGGNASTAAGDSYLNIKNYGTQGEPKKNISIQRVKYATIENSSMVLTGAMDRANDYDKELFAVSRVPLLTLKDNSEMYFEAGANLLESFKSVDKDGNVASVTIHEDGSITRNVDNRIYMYEGKNLNIAKDQQVTDYGDIQGMTFFGIYNYDGNGHVQTGIYDHTVKPGDKVSWNASFDRGSYVLAKHLTNHDIKVNGFYSNYMNEDTLINEVKYIEPTPESSNFYMWFIGENVIEYNVNLVASKYSTLGSTELAFLEFSAPNTSFQILNFNSNDIADGISLVDKDQIPRIGEGTENNTFGLTMEASNSGWLSKGKTSFYTKEPSMEGLDYYVGENSNNVPTMLFYLYHSKNISEEKDLGTVRISIMAITKESALESKVRRLVINVNMSTALFQTDEYEGAMTPGDKYELFASTTTNISAKSKFSAYYSIYSENNNLYKEGYHRVLSSNVVLPTNTKITMIDYTTGEPYYYYYIVTSEEEERTRNELKTQNDVTYPLSSFTKMGTDDTSQKYNDEYMNSVYYDGRDSSEEFIFIVDLSEANITTDMMDSRLLIELRDDQEETLITVLGIEHNQLTYNVYADKSSVINGTATSKNDTLYIGYNDTIDITIDYHNSSDSGTAVIDTQYFDSKLGLQVHLETPDGKIVSGTDLTGCYFLMDGTKYYSDIDGITHMSISEKVGNVKKWLTFNTENSNLPSGDYKFVFEAFGSPDGIYFSDTSYTFEMNKTIINSKYGIIPTISDNSIIFNGTDNDKTLNINIKYNSLLSEPNTRIQMYRRTYNDYYDTEYEEVDLQDYIDQELTPSSNSLEYILSGRPVASIDYTFKMKESLRTGTYKLVFKLYDNNTFIGDVTRYIIIK